MQLDFNILLVISILICFIIYILSYLSFISFLIITFVGIFVFITGRSISERCTTKLKSPANLELSTSTKKKKKTLSTHSNKDTSYRQYPRDIFIDENMHRNGFSNSSFNDKKFDRSFDKWRSPVASPVLRSPGIRISSPVVGTGLRTRKASQIISRRHSFSVKPTDTTIHSESGSRVPFLPTIKRALGLETIVSPRYTGKDDYNSFTSHPETASPGFVPAVRLSNHDRHPLSKVRSSSVRSPNTIKIAPPDPNKLGSPRVLEVRKRDTATDDNRKTPDMQSVLTALKEKRRKRTAGPPEEDNFCHEAPIQKSKRRRQESQQSNASTSSLPPLPASLPDLSDYSIPRLETPSLKRTAAPETSEWEGRGSNPKRLRQEGRYNSITSSLSSSRYLERNQRSYSPRPDWSQLQCEGAQDQSGKENLDVSVTNKSLSSNVQDPDSSSSSLQRAETVMLKPGLDSEDQSLNVSTLDASFLNQSQNKSMTPRQKVTLNKSFSVRKRQMSLYTGLNKSFSKVPKSNVVASMEDYEADREAEQRRVEQMLQDIVSTEEAEKDKGNAVTTSTVSSAVITPTVSTSKTALTSGLPSLSANPLLMSKATTMSTVTPATVSSTTPQTGLVSTSNSTLPSLTSTLKTTSMNQVLPNTSEASAPSSNMFSGLASSTTTAVSSSAPAIISSSKGSDGFSMTSPVTSNTQSNKNSAPSTKLGFQAAEPGTVGAALASIVAAAYPSKSSEENVSADKSTTASTNLGSVPNTAATNLSSLSGIVPSASVSNGFGGLSGFGGASNVIKTNVAAPVSSSGNATASSAFNVSSANNTGFSFGTSNVSQPVSSAPSLSFGSTTPATFNNNTSTNPTVSASNFQSSTAPSSFGAAAPSTQPKFTPVFGNQNPTTQANAFGASTGNTSAFGSTSSTFATPQNKTTFGNPSPEAPKAAGGFTFGGGATSSAPVFGAATNSAPSSTTSFPTASATTASSTFNFGNTAQTTAAASTFNFGNTTTQTTSSSTFNFGASNPTTTAAAATSFSFGGASNSNPQPTSTLNFGGATNATTTAAAANSSFNFGGNQTTTASNFNFGGATNTKPQAASSTFNFGGASNATPQTTSSTFSFGGTSNPTTSASTFGFGATSSTPSTFNFGANAANTAGATPAFGAPTPQVNTTSVFGGSKPSGTFQGGMTKSGSAPAFGDTGPSFGSGPKPSNPFGTSATFGGTAAPPASQTTNSGNNVFGFGATAQPPSASNTGGFNFNAAGAGSGTSGFNFGGNTAPTGFGAGSPAPAFGQAPSTPGQGMFTVGASNSAAKPRVMTKAKRRGARR